jgi:hypothetical protein
MRHDLVEGLGLVVMEQHREQHALVVGHGVPPGSELLRAPGRLSVGWS